MKAVKCSAPRVSFAPNYVVKQEIQIVGDPDGIRSSFGMIS